MFLLAIHDFRQSSVITVDYRKFNAENYIDS